MACNRSRHEAHYRTASAAIAPSQLLFSRNASIQRPWEFQAIDNAGTALPDSPRIAGVIAKFRLPVSYGAVDRRDLARHIGDLWTQPERTKLAHQYAFALSITGFQVWFNREALNEVAICVADRNDKIHISLKQFFVIFRQMGLGPIVSLPNFIDALHFAASEESIGLQLADCASFLIKRHLMDRPNSEEFYEIIEPCLCVDSESALR